MERRNDMRMWIGVVILMTLSLSVGVMASAGEQEDKSGSPGVLPTPDTEIKRVTGQLTHIEGCHYTIKDSTGQEVSFGVTQATQDPDKVKEGEHIVAMIGEDRIARFIKNVKTKKN